MSMLSVEQAIARILEGVEPLGPEAVPLAAAGGRVLASPLRATLTQPPFDASAMDGYAVRRADVASLPVTLTVLGEAAAGSGYKGPVGRGEAVRIFTGAPVPEGADAIIIQENTSREGDKVTVTDGSPDPEHIRPRGGDFSEGEALLGAGRVLDSRALTLAAAMGHPSVSVRRKPVVAILSTGDELVLPGTLPGPDQIVASNAFGLAALVAAFGAEPRILPIARDTRAALHASLDLAIGADILLTSGGASVGDHDLVAPVLKERGMALDFWKLAMRPGKPVFFGTLSSGSRGSLRVLGLPGNPVSTLLCGRVFGVPLIRALLGLAPDCWVRRRAVIGHELPGNGPRAHYMRATLSVAAHGLPMLSTACSQDSSLLKPLADANCLLVRPVKAPPLPAGSEVDVLMMDF